MSRLLFKSIVVVWKAINPNTIILYDAIHLENQLKIDYTVTMKNYYVNLIFFCIIFA